MIGYPRESHKNKKKREEQLRKYRIKWKYLWKEGRWKFD